MFDHLLCALREAWTERKWRMAMVNAALASVASATFSLLFFSIATSDDPAATPQPVRFLFFFSGMAALGALVLLLPIFYEVAYLAFCGHAAPRTLGEEMCFKSKKLFKK